MLIDTHLHLANEDYNVSKTIKEAKENDVEIFITGGTNKKNNLIDIELSKKHKEIYITLGYHPEYADEITIKDLELLEQQIINNKNKVVAIGEIGLDYYYRKDNKDKQIELFKQQIDIAKKYCLPIVIHSRDALEDIYNILKEKQVKGIIHCFSGSIETANKYIKLGFVLGINGIITFNNSHLKDVVCQLDLKNIVLETDSPYLSPERGKKNHPKNIKQIAEFVAKIKNMTVNEVSTITTNNAKEVFQIKE